MLKQQTPGGKRRDDTLARLHRQNQQLQQHQPSSKRRIDNPRRPHHANVDSTSVSGSGITNQHSKKRPISALNKENASHASAKNSKTASKSLTGATNTKTKTTNGSTCTTTIAAPPPPQTPYSLLKQEMSRGTTTDGSSTVEDDADESLLFSPPAVTTTSRSKRNSSLLKPTKLSTPPLRTPKQVSPEQVAFVPAARNHQKQQQTMTTKTQTIPASASKLATPASTTSNNAVPSHSSSSKESLSRAPSVKHTTIGQGSSEGNSKISQKLSVSKSGAARKSEEHVSKTVTIESQPSKQLNRHIQTAEVVDEPKPHQQKKQQQQPTARNHTKLKPWLPRNLPPTTTTTTTTAKTMTTQKKESLQSALSSAITAAATPRIQLPPKQVAFDTAQKTQKPKPPPESAASRQHWSAAAKPSLSVLHPPVSSSSSATPFAMRGNGVRMDLSNIFFDAARQSNNNSNMTVVKPPRRAQQPKSTKKQSQESAAAAKNTDEEWAEKQVQTFTQWLNYLFYPTESASSEEEVGGALSGLVLQQRMAQERLAAFDLWADMTSMRRVISNEIGRGRIALRTDRDLYANLNQRHKILTLLFSYTTPWLRLGLETVFGTIVRPAVSTSEKKGSGMRLALKNFIINHVLSDAKVLAKYTHGKCKVPSGSFEQKYRAELRTLVVYRLLTLILFLDRAKTANLLEQTPMLFHTSAKVKSTRDVLLSFCREFLKSEGDFVKHLSRVGLKVHYQQEAVNELDFTVTNLRVDLNDGVRLARMTELVTSGGAPLLPKLRLPAVSRLQKFHNVRLALDRLVQAGVELERVEPHHIVDGHREMVLKLLWAVVAGCCLQDLLSVEQVQSEIARIQKLHGIQQINTPTAVVANGDENDQLAAALMHWCNVVGSRFGLDDVHNLTTSFADGKMACSLIHYYHPTLLRLKEILPTTRDPTAKRLYDLGTLLSNEHTNACLANGRMSEIGGIPAMIPICDSTNPPDAKSMLFCLTYLCSRLMESSVEIRATVIIQVCYRRYRNRILRRFKFAAARTILKSWRLHRSAYFDAQKRRYGVAVQVIEGFVSRNKANLQLLRLRRLAFEKSRRAATMVQKQFRSFSAKQKLKLAVQQARSAVVLQSYWRAKAARDRYLVIILRRNAARTIQYYWRYAQLQDAKKNAAASQIQRVFRGYWSRVQLFIDVMDIVVAQSCARRLLAQRRRHRRVKAVEILQCAARCFLACKCFREKNVAAQRIRAAVHIESFARQCLAKNQLRQKKYVASLVNAATRIQSFARQGAAKKMLQAKKCEALQTNSAIRIQSFARTCLATKTLALTRLQIRASTRIQSTWRRKLAIKLFLTLKYSNLQRCAALLIQSSWRRFVSVILFQKLKSAEAQRCAATAIQCFVRANRAKRHLRQLRALFSRFVAAVAIQSAFRKHSAEILLSKMKDEAARVTAAIVVQAAWRGYVVQSQWPVLIYAATTIQASIRSFVCQKRFAVMTSSAIVIQAQWKSAIFVRRYNASVKNVLLIQTAIRMFLADVESCTRRLAVRQIQCSARQWLARKKLDLLRRELLLRNAAAVIVQCKWRGFDINRRFKLVRGDAIKIQSAVRKFVGKRASNHRRNAVVHLQQAARRWLARKRLRIMVEKKAAMELAELNSATCIQSAFRGWLIRREMLYLKDCATSIQRVFRGHVRRIDCLIKILDICFVQSLARRWLTKRLVAGRQDALLRLQCWARVCLARAERSSLILKNSASAKIQKTWRCYTVHVDYMLYILNAIKMQAFARRFIARTSYESKYSSIVRIQAFARLVLHKAQREREVRCIVKLQSLIRTFFWQKTFRLWLTKERSAIKLQSIFRTNLHRTTFLLEKMAVIVIQRYARGFVVRLQLETEHFAASEIQRVWRGFAACEYLAWNILSAIIIQSVWRMTLAKGFARERRLELIAARCLRQRNALMIQRAFRAHLLRLKVSHSATRIQQAVSDFLARVAFGKLRKGVLCAQAVVRGKIVRKQCSKKVRARAARIKVANTNAAANPKLRLGNRTAAALGILLKSKSLSEIMAAVQILEMATRLSKVCCISFVEAGAVELLFSLIRTCNRSLPHIQLLQGVLLTMANVAQYKILLPSLATITGAEVFLDLVQMFRDKDEIFCLVVSLLERVVTFSKEVMEFCTSKENMKRLRGVRDLCTKRMSVLQPTNVNRVNVRPPRLSSNGKQRSSGTRQQEASDIHSGVRTLRRVIDLIATKRV